MKNKAFRLSYKILTTKLKKHLVQISFKVSIYFLKWIHLQNAFKVLSMIYYQVSIPKLIKTFKSADLKTIKSADLKTIKSADFIKLRSIYKIVIRRIS
jgi:hypothetical protein